MLELLVIQNTQALIKFQDDFLLNHVLKNQTFEFDKIELSWIFLLNLVGVKAG